MVSPSGPSRDRAAKIGIVVYDGVEPIDIGGTVGVISMASRLLPNLGYVLLAEKAGAVRLASGLTVLVETDYAHASPCDVIVVLGGPGWANQVSNAATLAFLRGCGSPVASVCTGALILAAAGRLEGRLATTRRHAVGSEPRPPIERLAEFGPLAATRAVAVVADRGVVTGGGVSLAIDAMLFIIASIYGADLGADVARAIEYDRAFAANKSSLGHLVVS